ncbi:hypothetical protein L1987_43503 [Smallanthus sonchifolius]|uniref:Uncharacterized protein n=1 Tax=Smallanthus sonchifolius TaxID=185202 RepID=A0ACB9GL99_9ASTR|nr:hypothetical protein L1987_43503 [Smallanthus sonchifolius]
MLNVGKKRAQERGLGYLGSLVWVEGDAEKLTFKDDSMDGYTIVFGIWNVTHIEKVLAEAYRVLNKGGRFLCLELSHVDTPVFKQLCRRACCRRSRFLSVFGGERSTFSSSEDFCFNDRGCWVSKGQV